MSIAQKHARTKSERGILNIRIISKPQQKQISSYPQTSRRDFSQLHKYDDMLTRRKSIQNNVSLSMLKQNEVNSINTYKRCRQKNSKNQCTENQQQAQKQKSGEIEYIAAMLQKLMKKQLKQIDTIKQMSGIPQELEQSKQRNLKLKEELLEMKQLMKSLLLQREEDRMFKFYQDE